jgi:hypothetical protein
LRLDLFHGYVLFERGRVSKARKITQPFELSLRNLEVASINLGRRAIQSETAYPGLRRLVSSFYESLRTGAPLPISPEDGIAVASVRDLIMQSVGHASDLRNLVRA